MARQERLRRGDAGKAGGAGSADATLQRACRAKAAPVPDHAILAAVAMWAHQAHILVGRRIRAAGAGRARIRVHGRDFARRTQCWCYRVGARVTNWACHAAFVARCAVRANRALRARAERVAESASRAE